MTQAPQFLEDFLPHEVSLASDLLACATAPVTASNMRRTVMLLLRAHFSHGDNYGPGFDHLRCAVWAPENAGTLRVGYYPDFDDERPDDYPAVLVGFGGVALQRLVLGDYLGSSQDNATTFMVKDASLTLNVLCIAKQAGDAYDLAEMSARVITALATPMALRAGANSLEVTGWGVPAKELPTPDKYYAVAMNVRVGYNLLVSRSVESHRIRRIVPLTTTDHQ